MVVFVLRGFWTKKIQPFRKKFRQWRENCFLRVQRKSLRKYVFFWRWKSASRFLDLELKNWDLLLNTLWQRCLNYTILVQKNELNKISGVNYVFLMLLADWAKGFWPFSKYFPTGFTKLHSTCLEKPFEGCRYFERKICFNVWRWVINLKAFRGKSFGKYLNLHFACPDDFSRKIIFLQKFSSVSFSELERETVGLTGKIIEMVVTTALYVSRRYFC